MAWHGVGRRVRCLGNEIGCGRGERDFKRLRVNGSDGYGIGASIAAIKGFSAVNDV